MLRAGIHACRNVQKTCRNVIETTRHGSMGNGLVSDGQVTKKNSVHLSMKKRDYIYIEKVAKADDDLYLLLNCH